MDDKLSKFGTNLIVTPASSQLSLTYGGVSVAEAGTGEVPYLKEADLAAPTRRSVGQEDRGGHSRAAPACRGGRWRGKPARDGRSRRVRRAVAVLR